MVVRTKFVRCTYELDLIHFLRYVRQGFHSRNWRVASTHLTSVDGSQMSICYCLSSLGPINRRGDERQDCKKLPCLWRLGAVSQKVFDSTNLYWTWVELDACRRSEGSLIDVKGNLHLSLFSEKVTALTNTLFMSTLMHYALDLTTVIHYDFALHKLPFLKLECLCKCPPTIQQELLSAIWAFKPT